MEQQTRPWWRDTEYASDLKVFRAELEEWNKTGLLLE